MNHHRFIILNFFFSFANWTICDLSLPKLHRVELQPDYNDQMKLKMAKRETTRNSIKENEEITKFVHDLLLDDLPQIYNDE
jgi:hypothetical protein